MTLKLVRVKNSNINYSRSIEIASQKIDELLPSHSYGFENKEFITKDDRKLNPIPTFPNFDILEELIEDPELLQAINLKSEHDVERNETCATSFLTVESNSFETYSSQSLRRVEGYYQRWTEFLAKVNASYDTTMLLIRNKAELDILTIIGTASIIVSKFTGMSKKLLQSSHELYYLAASSFDTFESIKSASMIPNKVEFFMSQMKSSQMKKFKTMKMLKSLKNSNVKDTKQSFPLVVTKKRRKNNALPQILLKIIGEGDNLAYIIEQEIRYEKIGRRKNQLINKLHLSLPLMYKTIESQKHNMLLKKSNASQDQREQISRKIDIILELDWILKKLGENSSELLLREIQCSLSLSFSAINQYSILCKVAILYEKIISLISPIVGEKGDKSKYFSPSSHTVDTDKYLSKYFKYGALSSTIMSFSSLSRFPEEYSSAVEMVQNNATFLQRYELIVQERINSHEMSDFQPSYLIQIFESMQKSNEVVFRILNASKMLLETEELDKNELSNILDHTISDDMKLAFNDLIENISVQSDALFVEVELFKKQLAASVIPQLIAAYREQYQSIQKTDSYPSLNIQGDNSKMKNINSAALATYVLPTNSKSELKSFVDIIDIDLNDLEQVEELHTKVNRAILKSLDVTALLLEKIFFTILPSLLMQGSFSVHQIQKYLLPQGKIGWDALSLLKKNDRYL